MNIKISVIVPTYNSAKTIEACLCSIINQQEGIASISVSDNASSDSTIALVQRVFKDHELLTQSRMQLLLSAHDVNIGAYGNLNSLLSDHRYQSKDCYCYILCSDDYFANTNSYNLFLRDIVLSGDLHAIIAFTDNTTSMRERTRILSENKSQSLLGSRGLALFFLNGCFLGGLSNICVNVTTLSQAVNFRNDFKYYGDIRFYVDVLISGGSIWLSNTELAYRRHHKESISSTGNVSNNVYWENLDVSSTMIDSLCKENKLLLLFLLFYQHSVLLYNFYFATLKAAITFNFTPALNVLNQSGMSSMSLVFWCVLSVLMRRPVRILLRIIYTKVLMAIV